MRTGRPARSHRRTTQGALAALAAVLLSPLLVASPEAAALSGSPIPVSHADLPPALNLVAYARVEIPVDTELEVGTNVPEVAVLPDGGAILVDSASATAYLVGRDASVSSVALGVRPQAIVATPGPVLYGLAPTADANSLEFVAVSLMGGNSGTVIARQPFDAAQYLELPVGAFGNTAAGVVDRLRRPGTVMIGHVDTVGNPASYGFAPLWQVSADNVVTNGARQWALAIDRHTQWSPPLVGESPPAPTSGGGGVYWTSIGPAVEVSADAGPAAMPVIATLNADGSGAWHSVPTGWQVVASDTGGTLFARRVGDSVELARLDEALANPRLCDEYEDSAEYPLRRCDSGDAVTVVQVALQHTVAPELEVDGYFGPRTEQAVLDFQRSAGLEADGLVGPATWPALTAPFVYGTDDDSTGVVDPWELDPTPEVAGFPEDSSPLCDGCEIWAVVLAADPDFASPALAAAVRAAHDVGYATSPTGCDEGAAAAAGAPSGAATVSVYFATEAGARSAQTAFAARGVSSTVAIVRTGCLD